MLYQYSYTAHGPIRSLPLPRPDHLWFKVDESKRNEGNSLAVYTASVNKHK